MGVGSISLCMSFEDVVHHGQAETAHQFTIELQMLVAHALTNPVKVAEQMTGLIICEFDDRVLVQRDAAADAVVV